MNKNVTTMVPSATYGALKVWLEAEVLSAVEGAMHDEVGSPGGERPRDILGYGATPALAVISALEGVELAREWHRQAHDDDDGVLSGSAATVAEWIDEAHRFSSPDSDPKDLPDGFWRLVSHGMNSSAIQMLCIKTGMSTKSARMIVDKMTEYLPKAPKFEGTIGRYSVAANAPIGTVIRIKGSLDDGFKAGFVYEKLGDPAPPWCTTGDTEEFDNVDVQEVIDRHGYDLLYVPGARA